MDADAYLSWRPRLEYRLPKLAKLWRASLLGDVGASEALAELRAFEAEFTSDDAIDSDLASVLASEHASDHGSRGAHENPLPPCVHEVLTLGRAHLRDLASAWKSHLILLHGSVTTMLGAWLDRYGGEEDTAALQRDVEESIGALRTHTTPDSARPPPLEAAVNAMKAWAACEPRQKRTRPSPGAARERAAAYHARVRRMETAIARAFARDLRDAFASNDLACSGSHPPCCSSHPRSL